MKKKKTTYDVFKIRLEEKRLNCIKFFDKTGREDKMDHFSKFSNVSIICNLATINEVVM